MKRVSARGIRTCAVGAGGGGRGEALCEVVCVRLCVGGISCELGGGRACHMVILTVTVSRGVILEGCLDAAVSLGRCLGVKAPVCTCLRAPW